MRQIFNKYKTAFLLLTILSAGYFLLRLPNLTLQPIFADEAIYIRWAQVMRAEPTLRFLPLSDGKTPLFMWAMIPLFKFFSDPLFAGRFLSVLSGYCTFLGIIFLGWRFFNPRVGVLTAFFVTVTPLVVFFDRMALVDSMLTAFSIWSINLALTLVQTPRIDLAMLLGYTLGGALLTKTPGFFNLLSLPLSLISRSKNNSLIRLFGLWMIAIVISLAIYNILRLGPGFANLSSRNQDYVFSPIELLGRPFDPFLPHLRDLIDWLPKLLTIPTTILLLIGILVVIFTRLRVGLTVLLWSLLPLLVQMVLLKTFTVRYILFSITPLLILPALAIDRIFKERRLWAVLSLLLVLAFSLPFDRQLVLDGAKSPLPKEEKIGYFLEWTAGYGLKEIASFLIDQAKSGIVVVGTEGYFGTLPDGLEIYLDRYNHSVPENRRVIVLGSKATISAELRQAAAEHPAFFILNNSNLIKLNGTQKLKDFPKVSDYDFPQAKIILLKVLPVDKI